jgi:hypothetical protein
MSKRMKTVTSRSRGGLHAATWMVSAVLSLGSTAAGAMASEDASPGAAASRGAGSLRVEVEPRIDDAAQLPGLIEDRSGAAVAALDGPDAWVRVEIRGATYAYRIVVTPMRGGAPVGEASEPVVCECTSAELLDRVDVEVRRAVEVLERTPPAPVEPAEPAVTVGEPQPVASTGGVPPLTWVGKTGVALVAVGGAGVIAGAVMVAVNRGAPLGEGYGYLERDWRSPTGFVLLGVGGALVVGGVVPLVLDLRRCKRTPGAAGCGEPVGRAGRRSPAWVGAPWVRADGAGVGVTGRF